MDFVEGVGRASREGDFVGWVRIDDKSLNGNEQNILLRNLGGETPELVRTGYVAGVDRLEDSRGVGVLDIEGDGDLDVVVQGLEKPSVLLVNQGSAGNFLQVRLRGTRSNRDGIGARIEARVGSATLVREVSSTAGYISGRSLMSHFGLGVATSVDELTVIWPSGNTTRLQDVAANQRLLIEESAGLPE
jgi:hypothetical protein